MRIFLYFCTADSGGISAWYCVNMSNGIMEKPEKVVSLSDIARKMDSVSLGDDVVVIDTDFGKSDADKFPLCVDALMIILVKEGRGKIGIDLNAYDVTENTIVVLQPKNYIFLSECDDHCRAQVVACSKHVIEDVLPKLTDVLPLLLHHRTEPVSHLSRESADTLSEYFDFISRQLKRPKTMFVKQKVLRLLQAALYEMMDVNQNEHQTVRFCHSRKEEIMAKFIIAVTDNFRQERHVSYYADELCITPKHLSSVMKDLSGRTAGEWIDNYVIMEAKVLLKTTNKTIQEISDDLNFKNQSFFGKFFKHLTGFTPSQYRRENM